MEIAVNQSFNKRGNIDEKRLAKNLSKINGLKYINTEKEEIDVAENTEIKLTAKLKLKGHNYKINYEGKVSYKKEGTVEIEDILESPADYYGKYVTNYTTLSDGGINAQEGQKWQIFLADETNIYLIASNQIHKDYVPLNYDNSGNYSMYFTNILSLYDTNISGNPSVATILGKLSKQSQYHEWLNTPANLKNNNNQKAVLSMLDTDKWNEYMDGITKKGYKNAMYAEYVIGGPTLEMFCKSYNEIHDELGVIPRPKNNNNVYYQNGYSLQKEGTTNVIDSIGGLIDVTQTQMFLKCNYWLSSPSTRSSERVMSVTKGSTSYLNHHEYNRNTVSFRPLVCLKSNAHLAEKKNADTTTYELELD